MRDGTILWCMDLSQYITSQYVYQYCKLSIDTLIYWCIDMYQTIKCSLICINVQRF